MIEERDATFAADESQAPRQVDIRPTGLGVPTWMIMHKNHRARIQGKRAIKDIADAERCRIDIAFRKDLVAQETALDVEVEHTHALRAGMSLGEGQIVGEFAAIADRDLLGNAPQ